ncbi:Uncharacterized protein HZ326_24465, partial [Fusarium oxysporum f. sp. albedinis]
MVTSRSLGLSHKLISSAVVSSPTCPLPEGPCQLGSSSPLTVGTTSAKLPIIQVPLVDSLGPPSMSPVLGAQTPSTPSPK